MNKYVKACSVVLILFALTSCSRLSMEWESPRKVSKGFGFVPLYSEEELTQAAFPQLGFDSQEEQLYQTSRTEVAFRNVTFATDSYTIKGEDNLTILSNLVRYLRKAPRVTLYIEGHTDERGAAAYNLALGSRRANAVKQHLIRLGVSEDRLFTVSYGKEHPLNPGHNELAWQQNRRTEFKIHAH